ncbi:unnamed protein product [Paramecium sonneborni]|uniref:Protein kinase domain-containing protein n=1 Tax=Paramecium sonneborni TaxID=65129 RepID=A0A8S1NQA9_9CILI|nr:unnamed protein product [Paramecium sonneborni]
MILQFKCERLHYILNTHYVVNVYKDKLTIGKNSHPKYEYKFTLENVLHWYIEGFKIQAFGIKHNNLIKFFKANHKDLDQLRILSRGLIYFDNLVEFYKQIDIDDSSKILDQFSQETYTLKSLNDVQLQRQVPFLRSLNHPNILRVRECFLYNNQPYVVTEYVSGTSLQNYLAKNPKSSHLQCQSIIIQLLRALKVLHENHIIHATIQAKFLLFKSDLIKIIEFSQAFQSEEIDSQDIKNCGSILFQLYTNKLYNNYDQATVQSILQANQTPNQAQDLILKMLFKQQFTVYQSLEHPYFSNTLNPQEKKRRFQNFQKAQRSTSEMDESEAVSQYVPELQTNKSKSLRQLL